ncbi:MAG: hypothetical protein QM778_19890 [Myxococcales bacterium]
MYRSVEPGAVVRTVEKLRDRILERFPESGLSRVAAELHEIASHAADRAVASARPLLLLRAGVALLSLLILAGLFTGLSALPVPLHFQSTAELIQTVEAAVNDLVFLGVGIFFLIGLEDRLKRKRVLAALHELRALAHIIDMHQLTKDPDHLLSGARTKSSPERNLSRFQLGRYLDYCTEMLALIGKVGALYAQYTSDAVALSAVDQVEDLTSSLSHKIWQKIMVLHQLPAELPTDGDSPSMPTTQAAG